MDPSKIFFGGCTLLVLFAWYVFSDGDRAKRILGTVLSILMLVFCLLLVYPPFDIKDKDGKLIQSGKIALGIDLRGGTSFLIHLVPPAGADGSAPRKITRPMVEQAMEAIRKRVDTMGVAEPIITPQGEERILVQIPNLDQEKLDEARRQLKQVAKLEFRMVHPRTDEILAGMMPPDPNYMVAPYKEDDEKKAKGAPEVKREIVIRAKPDLTGDHVTDAWHSFQQQWEVDLKFDKVGSDQFATITRDNVGQRFAIVLDGEVISAPKIMGPIPGGNCQISGSFNEKSSQALASALQNPLQTPVVIEEERHASSTLGASAIHSGIYAGVGGLLLVLLFVVVYYRFAGLVAVLGLVANIVILFGVMAMFGFVLTLPGIAGIILTIGLAVDANVLIYERLREEMDAGKPLSVALISAYDKAFTVIFDANATTLITAAILFWQASGPVKGFAVALTVGVIASVFSAMVVTRAIFAWALHLGWLRDIKMLHIIPTGKNFNFLGRRRLWISISVVLTILSIVVFAVRGEKNFGIDFKGGDLLTISSTANLSEGEVREKVEQLHLGEVVVQKEKAVGETKEFISIRSPKDTAGRIFQHVQKALPEAGITFESQSTVGTLFGAELARGSLIAFGLGIIGILAYVTIRFEFAFAIGAIVALLHDVLLTVGFFSIFGKELSLIMVGAILTIAGYSINDTIVVYDRIREGLHSGRRGSVQDIMNASINETLSRTLLTSGCTFLSVASLFFFGGPVLHDFAFAILIGIVVGTYSSIFIASPIVLWWSGHKREKLQSPVRSEGSSGALAAKA